MAAGYFAVPRGITLTDLAARLDRSKSAVSESIAIIERKLLESPRRSTTFPAQPTAFGRDRRSRMTTIRIVAAHEVVRAAFPRPVTERDEVAMAVGKAIDGSLSRYSYDFAQGRRPTRTAMNRLAEEILDDELAGAGVEIPPDDRARELVAVSAVLQAFRRSEVMGLTRPRSRLILINGEVGVYAQPDFWDGKGRIYEMKSYHAVPTPPDIQLQVELFQCAFPGFRAFLAWFDRHATPVTTTIDEVPELRSEELERTLRLAYRTSSELGVPKVLEFIDAPTIPYTILPG
ncbi:MAG: helix-turn-helix domain-containing protein [Thermoplasmata archaeon]|nr:helix-turn-helix domain-containing protein [Thermoplasmata archaeon]